MSRRNVKILHRAIASPEEVTKLSPLLEQTYGQIVLDGGEPCRLFTIRGVPGSKLLVAMSTRTQPHDGHPLVVEVGERWGSYDNIKGDVLNFRWLQRLLPEVEPASGGVVTVTPSDSAVSVAVSWDGGAWEKTYQRLSCDLSNYNLSSIVWWNYRRYFSFLPDQKVDEIAATFEERNPGLRGGTMSQANRVASLELYNLAISLGWRKMDVHEQARKGLTSPWIYGPSEAAGAASHNS